MEFTISQKVFCAALARVQSITTGRATMPILSHVLLRASSLDPVLHVSATDLEVGYSTVIDCEEVTQMGAVAVPAKKLYEVIKAAPCGEVVLQVTPENERVTVRAGTYQVTLAAESGDNFPACATVSGDELQLDCAALLQLIAHVEYAQSSDDLKYNLAGVFFRITEDDDGRMLHAVATDGHRLTVDNVPLPGEYRSIPADLLTGVIVPRKGVAELKKIGRAGVLLLQLAGNSLSVSTGNEIITVRLIDGEFPAYQKIVPTAFQATVEANRLPLIDALSRTSLLSQGKTTPVDMLFADREIIFQSKNPELGESCDKISAVLELHRGALEGNIRRLNAGFLIQALSVLDCDSVHINLSDPFSPLLVRPVGEALPCSVIMPMRNQG